MKLLSNRIASRFAAQFAIAAGFIAATLSAQPAVEVVKVVARRSDRTVSLPGEFLPYQAVAIQPKVTGFVESIEVDRGSIVRKDQLLAQLSAPELKSQILEAQSKVKAAESQRTEAEAKLLALRSTHEKLKAAAQTPGAISGNELETSQKTVDAASAQVQSAALLITALQASVASLEEMQAYLTVRAPFAGVITERNVHPGALVGPGARSSGPAMFQLEQTSVLRLVVSVPEVDVPGIAAGSTVSFTVTAYPGRTFQGRIARIAHSMDPKTRSMAVELDVQNPTSVLAPGMYPTLTWPVRKTQPSLLVPPGSVVTTTERTFVIRVQDGTTDWVTVSKGPSAGDLIEVFGPLKDGDSIVRRGSDELRPGTKVRAQISTK
jgi:membrane fusion protein (multidrug efflux system)